LAPAYSRINLAPILPNTIFPSKFSYKFVKNEAYQIFTSICKPNLPYLTSILQKIGSKCLKKNFLNEIIGS
jgi:hypothetical protein